MSGAWCRRGGAGWILDVYVQPGAAKSGVAGLHGGRLKLRIAAPASDGRANAALVVMLADRLGVARRDVVIESGLASRAKRVSVTGAARDPRTLLD